MTATRYTAALFVVLAASPALAEQSHSQRIPNSRPCGALIASVSEKIGQAGVNIVEVKGMRILRYCTADGSVLLTCVEGMPYVVATTSDGRGGCPD